MEIVSKATEDIYILTESHNLHKSLGMLTDWFVAR